MTKDREKPKGHKGFFSLGCCWKYLFWGCPDSRAGERKEARASSLERRIISDNTRFFDSTAIPMLLSLKNVYLFLMNYCLDVNSANISFQGHYMVNRINCIHIICKIIVNVNQ